MKLDEVLEILKKCFGKEKDTRYHAIAMLGIYAVIFAILIIFIRVSGSNVSYNQNEPLNTPGTTNPPIEENKTNNEITSNKEDENQNIIDNDINYSYSYTITHNGKSEIYLGKKIDEKEKFTLIKDSISTNYAILNDNYLIEKNGVYSITQKPSIFFKYCDVENILLLIKDKADSTSYTVTNNELKLQYNDNIVADNFNTNTIKLNVTNDVLKSIDLDFSSYYSSITNNKESLTIHMEFADIGTTEDFDINIS